MSEPVWLSTELVVAIHEEQLALFGGLPGMRDQGLLESALARPINKFVHGAIEDQSELAASLAFGIVRNHPFADGNKRTGFLSMITFLGLNGVDFRVADAEAVAAIVALAAGEIDEDGLARWIRDRSPG